MTELTAFKETRRVSTVFSITSLSLNQEQMTGAVWATTPSVELLRLGEIVPISMTTLDLPGADATLIFGDRECTHQLM